MKHIRAAARLRPAAYAAAAKPFASWEEAERLSKEADRRERLDRERMVDAMRASLEAKRLEEEEDAAVAEEAAAASSSALKGEL